VIVQSGITDRTLDAERGALVAKSLCEACAVNDLAGLERLPADTIVSAQTAVLPQLLKPVGMMPFHPCVDDDLLDAAPAAAFRAGRGADVPLIAGSTSEEMNLFLGFAPAVARDRLVGRVARYVGVDEVAATAVVERYEAEVGPDGVWPALFTDAEMQVPLRRVLEARASATAPTYAYLFTWRSPAHGAFHAVDLPFTFDAFDVDGWGDFVGFDGDAARLGRDLRSAWSAFARDGDPGWAPYPATHVFGRESSDVAAHPLFARQQGYWRG
jgi:para-nitrobenzyl esterase